MSLGGGRSRALDAAVNAATRRGVFFAVAAGNDNRDAVSHILFFSLSLILIVGSLFSSIEI